MCWAGILGTTCHGARGTVCPAAAVSPGAAEQPLQQLLQQQQQSLGCRGGSRGGEQAAECVVDLLGVFSQVQVAPGRLGTRRGGWGSCTVPADTLCIPPQHQYQKERTCHDTTENHNLVQALGCGAELPSSMGGSWARAVREAGVGVQQQNQQSISLS